MRRHLDEFLVERDGLRCAARRRRAASLRRRRDHDFLGSGLAVDDGDRRGVGAARSGRAAPAALAPPLAVGTLGTAGGRSVAARARRRVGRFRRVATCRLAGTTAIGSPPNGSSPTIAQSTNTPRNSASAPAMICGTGIAIARRRFFGCRPSGALRSSAVIGGSWVSVRARESCASARIMPGSLSRPASAARPRRSAPRSCTVSTARGTGCTTGLAGRKKFGAACEPPRTPDQDSAPLSSERRSSDSAGRRRWSPCRAADRAPS